MDILNEYYPLYPENPDTADLTDTEQSEREDLINAINAINPRKNKKKHTFDIWSVIYTDQLWYLWCMILEYNDSGGFPFLDKMDYGTFCSLVYDNSSK